MTEKRTMQAMEYEALTEEEHSEYEQQALEVALDAMSLGPGESMSDQNQPMATLLCLRAFAALHKFTSEVIEQLRSKYGDDHPLFYLEDHRIVATAFFMRMNDDYDDEDMPAYSAMGDLLCGFAAALIALEHAGNADATIADGGIISAAAYANDLMQAAQDAVKEAEEEDAKRKAAEH